MKEIREKIIECLENLGFVLDKMSEEKDVDLSEYILDSIDFVQFLVELEETFAIDIPDSMLGIDVLKSLNGLANMILELKKTRNIIFI